MEVIYILVAFSLLLATGFLAAFLWAVRSGQFDDTTTPSMRILMDEEAVHKAPEGQMNEEEKNEIKDG